jgi:hypothetical protein
VCKQLLKLFVLLCNVFAAFAAPRQVGFVQLGDASELSVIEFEFVLEPDQLWLGTAHHVTAMERAEIINGSKSGEGGEDCPKQVWPDLFHGWTPAE